MAAAEEKKSFDHMEKVASTGEDIEPQSRSAEWHTASRSLTRKLDMTLMPTVWILYVFNYLDRNNIAYV